MHPADVAKLQMIDHLGFCFNPVRLEYAPGKITDFLYTSGFQKNFGHPEIFLIGYHPQDAANLIGSVVWKRIKAGERFDTPVIIGDFSDVDLYAFRPMCQDCVDEHGARGQSLIGQQFSGVQLFFTDENNLFPWEDGCNARCTAMQTSIFKTTGEVPTLREARGLRLN